MGYSVRDKINDDIRLKQKRKKIKKGGTFIDREMYQSEAFMSLKRTFSPKLLLLFLDKRIQEPKRNAKDRKGNKRKPKFINLDNINMPYSELEKKYGVSRQTITRAIDELLEKGFIEIRHHGGTCKHDKTVYALIDKWIIWKPGMAPFSSRQRDIRRGYQGKKNKATERKATPIYLGELNFSRTNCHPYTRTDCDPKEVI